MRWRCLAATGLAILAAAQQTMPALRAQSVAARTPSCIDSLPATLLKRVPVYAASELLGDDPLPPTAVWSMDLLMQAVAEQARTLLGAGTAQLPPGDPHIGWRQLEHRLLVVVRPDGRLTWRVQPPAWVSDMNLDDAGARHLGRALDSARARGEAFFWDDAIRQRDSVAWLVRLEPALLSSDGTLTPPTLRVGFPVFTVLAPPIQLADVERIRTNFPMVRVRGFSGTVRLQFVIDTAGRAVPSTIRDVWPSNEPRLFGPQKFAYDSVVRVMRVSLEAARFAPARVGRCTISQRVQQAFTYRPAR